MTILEDTRQQDSKHINKHAFFERQGISVVRSKLVVGDYTLPTNQQICIDTKKGLGEVYGNMVQQHERFRAECVKAQELGIHLIILVEEYGVTTLDGVRHWSNPRVNKYNLVKRRQAQGYMLNIKLPPKPPLSSERLEGMMRAMQMKYDIEWQFCEPSVAGQTICNILGIPIDISKERTWQDG